MNYRILLLLLFATKIFTQNLNPFTVLNEKTGNFNNKQNSNFFPLGSGDFWEYVEEDTVSVDIVTGYHVEKFKFSIVKEVIGDTAMPNRLDYKILKWENCANSVDEQPWYEYLRKDTTGNVYIYYENDDYLLYDFTKNVNELYSSHYENYKWKVLKKYTVEGFNQQLTAIDFGLYDSNTDLVRTETITENFGLTYYKGDINNEYYYDFPEGGFFGGIINDSTYGYLLTKRQEINWSEFYPLHIEDFWKYRHNDGLCQSIIYKKVVKDTLLSDGNTYQIIQTEEVGGRYPGKGVYFERFDSTTNSVFRWNSFDSTTTRKYKFTSCLGDTIHDSPSHNSYFRLDDKSYDYIHFFFYPDLISLTDDFAKGLGLIAQTSHYGIGIYLLGAAIDGKVSGDTSIVTGIDDESYLPNNFKLYQNYPNPFNPATTIKFTIPKYSKVTLKVYDLLGREIRTLIDEKKTPGSYNVLFNAKGLSSGVYIYKLNTGKYSVSKKLILLK
ncbi:MAG: T9SS type A sorting domain-containing protein [Ignavibacteria bacterium]|jgi:hypothetical protein